MPFLRFHSTDSVKLAAVSRKLTDRVQNILNCPREHILLEVVCSEIITDGEITAGEWPFVEISWFERTLDQQDAVACAVYDCLKEAGYPNADIHFQYLRSRNYYENGVNYSE